MLSKMRQLRKQLLLTFIIRCSMVIALLVGMVSLQHWRDDWQQKTSTLETQVRGLQSQHAALQAQYQKAKESIGLYQNIMNKGDASGFDLNREHAKAVFDSLKFMHHLSTLNVSMSAIQSVEKTGYQPKIAQMVASDLRLTFEGVSDEEALAMIATLRKKLSGYVKVEEVSLRRYNALTGEVLVALTRGELLPLIKGEMVIRWIGSKLPDVTSFTTTPAIKEN